MSALNLSPKNPIVLAVLGIGAFWLMTQRRATAGTTYGANLANQSAASKVYGIPISAAGVRQVQPAASPVSSILSIGSQLLNSFNPGRVAVSSYGTQYYPAAIGNGVSAEADGNIGEAAAQEYFSNHADQFIVNTPTITQDMFDRAALEGMSEY